MARKRNKAGESEGARVVLGRRRVRRARQQKGEARWNNIII